MVKEKLISISNFKMIYFSMKNKQICEKYKISVSTINSYRKILKLEKKKSGRPKKIIFK